MLLGMLSGLEIGIIVLVILLVLGPSKLPQLGSSVGKMLRGFKKEMSAIDEDKQAAADAKGSKAIESDERPEIDVTPKKTAE